MAKKTKTSAPVKMDRDILLVILGVVAVVAIASLVVLFVQTLSAGETSAGQVRTMSETPQTEETFANRGLTPRSEAYPTK